MYNLTVFKLQILSLVIKYFLKNLVILYELIFLNQVRKIIYTKKPMGKQFEKIRFTFFIFIIYSASIIPQNMTAIDSLIKASENSSGEHKVDLLNDLSDSYLRSSPESSVKYASEALQTSKKINYKKGQGDAYNQLGIANYYLAQFSDALTYYNYSLAIRKELNNKKDVASSLNNIGLLYSNLGNYQKSLEYGLEALKTREEIGNQYYIGVSLLNIGIVYFNIGDINSALEYDTKALKVMQSIKKENVVLILLVNIGSIYRRKGSYNKAMDYYNRSVNLSNKLGDKKGAADAYYSIATINWMLKKYKTALNYYKKSLAIYESLGDKYDISSNSNSIAITYANLKEFDKMKSYLQRALKLALEIKSKPLIQDNYEYTSTYYEGKKNFSEALKYFHLYSEIKDTILNQQSNDQIEELKTRYETEKKEQKILQLQQGKKIEDKEIEVKNIWETSLVIGLILTGILLFVLYNRYNLEKKAEAKIKKQNVEILAQQEELKSQAAAIQDANEELRQKNITLENLNEEKDMFLGIAAHDLKNPLTSIIVDTTTVKLYQQKNRSGEISQKMEEIESTAKRMKDIITKLLDLNAIETGKLNLVISEFDLVDLMNSITEVYKEQALRKGIHLYFNSKAVSLKILSDKSVLMQIIDNIISNAVKFSGSGKSIYVDVDKSNNQSIISIKDEGPGFKEEELKNMFKRFAKFSAKPTSGENSSGLGLSISKKLIDMLNGKISIESKVHEGSTFFIELPMQS